MTDSVAIFAAMFAALYASHHVGDYWVQTDHQAAHKGAHGAEGRWACTFHVLTYLITQAVFVALVWVVLSLGLSTVGVLVGLLVSGVTHYLADRREHGIMLRLARLLPGKDRFLKLGVPRAPRELEVWAPCESCEGRGTSYDASTGGKCWDCRAGGLQPGRATITDNPSLGTGGWALDQAWHIALGVFAPALIIAGLS